MGRLLGHQFGSGLASSLPMIGFVCVFSLSSLVTESHSVELIANGSFEADGLDFGPLVTGWGDGLGRGNDRGFALRQWPYYEDGEFGSGNAAFELPPGQIPREFTGIIRPQSAGDYHGFRWGIYNGTGFVGSASQFVDVGVHKGKPYTFSAWLASAWRDTDHALVTLEFFTDAHAGGASLATVIFDGNDQQSEHIVGSLNLDGSADPLIPATQDNWTLYRANGRIPLVAQSAAVVIRSPEIPGIINGEDAYVDLVSLQVVPEPSSAILLGGGLVSLLLVGRRVGRGLCLEKEQLPQACLDRRLWVRVLTDTVAGLVKSPVCFRPLFSSHLFLSQSMLRNSLGSRTRQATSTLRGLLSRQGLGRLVTLIPILFASNASAVELIENGSFEIDARHLGRSRIGWDDGPGQRNDIGLVTVQYPLFLEDGDVLGSTAFDLPAGANRGEYVGYVRPKGAGELFGSMWGVWNGTGTLGSATQFVDVAARTGKPYVFSAWLASAGNDLDHAVVTLEFFTDANAGETSLGTVIFDGNDQQSEHIVGSLNLDGSADPLIPATQDNWTLYRASGRIPLLAQSAAVVIRSPEIPGIINGNDGYVDLVSLQVVPEPSSAILLSGGLVSLLVVGRRIGWRSA